MRMWLQWSVRWYVSRPISLHIWRIHHTKIKQVRYRTIRTRRFIYTLRCLKILYSRSCWVEVRRVFCSYVSLPTFLLFSHTHTYTRTTGTKILRTMWVEFLQREWNASKIRSWCYFSSVRRVIMFVERKSLGKKSTLSNADTLQHIVVNSLHIVDSTVKACWTICSKWWERYNLNRVPTTQM